MWRMSNMSCCSAVPRGYLREDGMGWSEEESGAGAGLGLPGWVGWPIGLCCFLLFFYEGFYLLPASTIAVCDCEDGSCEADLDLLP